MYVWVTDQACGQDGWIFAIGKFFFCVLVDRDGVELHKLAKKKERGQYQAILTKKAWSIKDLLYGFREKQTLSRRTRRVVPEVFMGKSRTETLPYWPSDSEVNTARPRFEIFP